MSNNVSYSLVLVKNTPPVDKEINESLRDFFRPGIEPNIYDYGYCKFSGFLSFTTDQVTIEYTYNEAFTELGPFRCHL